MPRPMRQVELPDGTVVQVEEANYHYHVQYLVVVEGEMMVAHAAVTLVTAHRDYWKQRANFYETKFADAAQKLREAGIGDE